MVHIDHNMIKILFFIETLDFGGAEKVLRNLVNHMDQSRFDITVQTIWPSEEGRKESRTLCFGLQQLPSLPSGKGCRKEQVAENNLPFSASQRGIFPLFFCLFYTRVLLVSHNYSSLFLLRIIRQNLILVQVNNHRFLISFYAFLKPQ